MVPKKHAYLATAALAGTLLLSACGAAAGPSQAAGGAQAKPGGPPPAPVNTVKVEQGPITAGVSFTGDVTAAKQVSVAPKSTGILTSLDVSVGSVVHLGQILAQLDHSSQDAAVAQAQAQVEVAQAKLASEPEEVAKAQDAQAQAQAKLSELQQQGRPESVAEAQATLDTATAKLRALQNGVDQQTITADQAAVNTAQAKLDLLTSSAQQDAYREAVTVAKNSLYAAQIARDAACNPRNPATTCNAAQATANAAQTALDNANDQFAINTDPNTIGQAQNALKQAQAQLAKDSTNAPSDLAQAQAAVSSAQQALALAKNPNQAGDIAQQVAVTDSAAANTQEVANDPTAQANVDAAQANLAAAQVTQQQTQVTAPFDGVVSAVLLSEGALASPSVPIFTIVSNDVQVNLPVAQEQIGQITPSQLAKLTTPAYPNQTFDAKISSISPAADPKSRTFLVAVAPVNDDGKLKPGMSATVVIDTIQKQNVLLLPVDAVTTDPNSGAQGVYIVQSGQNGDTVAFKAITLGVSDGKNYEVLSGLNPGDTVVVSGQTSLINNQRVRPVQGGGQPGAGAASGVSGRPQGATSSGRPQGATSSGRPQGATSSGRPRASVASASASVAS